MKLIDEWKSAWRFLSVKIQAGVVALTLAWTQMPQEWRDAIPKYALIGAAALFAIATIGGRVVKQVPKVCDTDPK